MGAEESVPAPCCEGLASNVEVGLRCRQTAGIVVRAFINLMQEVAVEGKVSLDDVQRIGAAVMGAGGPLANFYSRTETRCETGFAMAVVERQRTDFFGRLLCSTFEHLLDQQDSGIERKNLPQFFAAVRMLLGEDSHEDLKSRSTYLVERNRGEDGLIDWPRYFADPEAQLIIEQVLVTLARSFRRFEPRRDWFLIVMNSSPSAISLGSSVFVPKRQEDKVTRGFNDIHMVRLFEAMFATMRSEAFDSDRRKGFVERWGVEPEKIFGPLFVEILRMAQHSVG